MDVLVPYDALSPKTRLEPILDEHERRSFAEAMLHDVLAALDPLPVTPRVVSTAPLDLNASVFVDERDLTPAINAALQVNDPPLAVVMADLPLATPDALECLFDRDGDVVIAPGIGGGTNAFLVRKPGFSVDFHGCSFADHREIAADAGLSVSSVDSFRLAVDIDEVADLAEVLIHGDGDAAAWLREHGIDLVIDDVGRVDVERHPGD